MKKLLFLFIIVSVSLFSCSKDDPFDREPDPQDTTNYLFDSCRIKKAHYYGGGGIHDTANFIYENGRLIRIEGDYEKNVVYHYSGNRIVAMEYFEMPGNQLYNVDSLFYLNDSMVSKVISHGYDLFFSDTFHTIMNFNYSGGKLASILTTENMQGVPETDTLISTFHYTGDNITMMTMESTSWAGDTIWYQYDNQPNYFRNVSRTFFLADPFFEIHVGFEPHLPYFLSRNNVTQFTIYSNVDYPVEYELDSLHHPVMVRQGGFDYMGYEYECP